MEELKNVLRKVLKQNYANFNGRASRSEFWLFAFMQYIYMMVFFFIFYIIFIGVIISLALKGHIYGGTSFDSLFLMLIFYGVLFLIFLPILLPSFAVTARRLHDVGRSGWWILLMFVPIAGILVFFFLVQQGTKGTNEYGEDPRVEEYKAYLEDYKNYLS